MSATPITDLIAELVSQGLSLDSALKAARIVEEKAATIATSRGAEEIRRQYERDRKAAYRARTSGTVSGTQGGDISSSTEVKSQKESKKDSSLVPNVPDKPGRLALDDWPTDHLEKFWNAYPKQRRTEKANVAKKLARLRATGTVTWAELMAGVERYGRSSDVARGFAKGPMPWLNGGCWKDEIATRGPHDGNLGTGGQQNLGFAGIAGALRAKRLAREIDERDAPADVRPGNRQGSPQLALVRLEDRREESENPAPPNRR